MARLSILLLMCVMVVGCGTFEPKPGMTVKELNSMSALSFKGNIVRAGGFNNIGVDIYETSNQNRRRVRNATPPEGGWTFVYVRGGRVISEQEVRNLQAEAEKSAQQKPRTTPGPVASRSTSASNTNQRTSRQTEGERLWARMQNMTFNVVVICRDPGNSDYDFRAASHLIGWAADSTQGFVHQLNNMPACFQPRSVIQFTDVQALVNSTVVREQGRHLYVAFKDRKKNISYGLIGMD